MIIEIRKKKEEGEVVHTYTLKNQCIVILSPAEGSVYDKLTFIHLEMPNFTKKENELENRFDQWLYFFKNLETFTVIPEIFKNDIVFTEAIEKAELSRMGEDALATYYAGLKEYRDNNSKIKTAKNEGLKEGEEIGKKKEKLEIAKNCIEDGMGIQKIAKLTCLSEEEIRGIAL